MAVTPTSASRFRPDVRLELGSNEAIKESVAGGLGLGVISRHALHGHQRENGVRILDVEGFPCRRFGTSCIRQRGNCPRSRSPSSSTCCMRFRSARGPRRRASRSRRRAGVLATDSRTPASWGRAMNRAVPGCAAIVAGPQVVRETRLRLATYARACQSMLRRRCRFVGSRTDSIRTLRLAPRKQLAYSRRSAC